MKTRTSSLTRSTTTKKRETSLWEWFNNHLPNGAMAERIENSLARDMPDVLLTYKGVTVLIELKSIRLPGPVKIRSGQADWHSRWMKAGGLSWILIRTDLTMFLVAGHYSRMLYARSSWTDSSLVRICSAEIAHDANNLFERVIRKP